MPTPEQVRLVEAAITSRRSVRAFLPTLVARAEIEEILAVASRAPSGTNTQPWRVYVLTGAAQAELSRRLVAAYDDPVEQAAHREEYAYYPTEWRTPFIERRRKVGWDLYGLLGIAKTDKARMHAQHRRNYEFFGAPVGMMFTIDRVMQQGSWLDFGMFLQSIMVGAPRPRPRHLPAGRVHAVSPDHHARARGAAERAAGVRHVARPGRPGRDREHARDRARSGGAVCDLPRHAAGVRARAMKPAVLVCRRVFADVLARLREHFEVEANDDDTVWSRDELIARLQGKDGAFLTGTQPIDAALLDACPRLRAVCSMAVGYNNIDVPACTARGVLVSNAPDVLTETTADFGFALMMAAARRISESEHFLRRGEWTKWSVDLFAGADVHGATLAILGMGRIGRAIARRGAKGFAMPVIYHNRSRLDGAVEAELGARYVDMATLLREADHLVVVVPYTAESHHLVGAAELASMKPGATLTNIARGGVVDDAALARALREGRLAAAGLDVFEGEPVVRPELLALSNVVLTPHIASASLPTRRAMAQLAAANLIAALDRRPGAALPPTPLNPEVLGAGRRRRPTGRTGRP